MKGLQQGLQMGNNPVAGSECRTGKCQAFVFKMEAAAGMGYAITAPLEACTGFSVGHGTHLCIMQTVFFGCFYESSSFHPSG